MTALTSDCENEVWDWLWGNSRYSLTKLKDQTGVPYSESVLEQKMKLLIGNRIIYPDGTREQQSWFQGTLDCFQSIQFFIFCMYITDQYGKYTWEVTVTDDDNGDILNERSISWERAQVGII